MSTSLLTRGSKDFPRAYSCFEATPEGRRMVSDAVLVQGILCDRCLKEHSRKQKDGDSPAACGYLSVSLYHMGAAVGTPHL